MSAAEPADPTHHPALNAQGRGAVIDITKHRRRSGGATTRSRGRWSSMTASPGPDRSMSDGERTALERFADDIEVSLNEVGHSLTDDDAATVFVRTLQVCARALEGSHATGLIDEKQLRELLAVIRGMEQAPRLLA